MSGRNHMKLSDEDVERIAKAVARNLQPVRPAPYVLPSALWQVPTPYYNGAYATGTSTGTIYNT